MHKYLYLALTAPCPVAVAEVPIESQTLGAQLGAFGSAALNQRPLIIAQEIAPGLYFPDWTGFVVLLLLLLAAFGCPIGAFVATIGMRVTGKRRRLWVVLLSTVVGWLIVVFASCIVWYVGFLLLIVLVRFPLRGFITVFLMGFLMGYITARLLQRYYERIGT